MGPYCKFCGHRCFIPFPQETPKHILAAYGSTTIIATCPGGQQYEKQKVGCCYDDIKLAIAQDTVRDLLAALKEITERFERLERYFFEATGQQPDCDNGSVMRAHTAIAKAERVIL